MDKNKHVNRHNYEYDVDLNTNTAPAYVVRMVGEDKRVLEVGAGPGSITRLLKGVGNCSVTGLEIDPAAIKKLKPFCERIYEANLNDPAWPELLSDEAPFDVLVAADVLEHVYEPWTVLKAMAEIAGNNGEIVISLPHVSYHAVIACLLSEDFAYRDWGLLDKTHIRFFGLKNMQQLFEDAGLKIIDAHFVITPPQQSEFADKWNALGADLRTALSSHRHGQVYQVVIKAVSRSAHGDAIDLMSVPVDATASEGQASVSIMRKIARKCLSEQTRYRILNSIRKK